MPRWRSISIKSEAAPFFILFDLTAPRLLDRSGKEQQFFRQGVLPASGCEMMPKVRRRAVSSLNPILLSKVLRGANLAKIARTAAFLRKAKGKICLRGDKKDIFAPGKKKTRLPYEDRFRCQTPGSTTAPGWATTAGPWWGSWCGITRRTPSCCTPPAPGWRWISPRRPTCARSSRRAHGGVWAVCGALRLWPESPPRMGWNFITD